jgi:hypothetical protein
LWIPSDVKADLETIGFNGNGELCGLYEGGENVTIDGNVINASGGGATYNEDIGIRITSPGRWNASASPVSSLLNGVAYGDGLFAAVASSATVLTSIDGFVWTESFVTSGIFYNIAYGNETFVLSTASVGIVYWSQDGITWTARSTGSTNILRGMTFLNGLFMAAGYNGSIVTSPDGRAWDIRDAGVTNVLFQAAFGNGFYVVVGTAGKILTSTNSIDWTSQISNTTDVLNDITYGNGLFVAVGAKGTIVSSPDGVTWTKQFYGTLELRGIVYAGGLFRIVGSGGTIVTSPDGVSWTPEISGVATNLYDITYGSNGLCVAVGSSGGIVTKRIFASIQARVDGKTIGFNAAGELCVLSGVS